MIGKLDEEINISVIYRCGKDEFQVVVKKIMQYGNEVYWWLTFYV